MSVRIGDGAVKRAAAAADDVLVHKTHLVVRVHLELAVGVSARVPRCKSHAKISERRIQGPHAQLGYPAPTPAPAPERNALTAERKQALKLRCSAVQTATAHTPTATAQQRHSCYSQCASERTSGRRAGQSPCRPWSHRRRAGTGPCPRPR